MKSLLGWMMALGLVASMGEAQDWARAKLNASPRHTEWVTVKHGDRSVQCFVAYPEVADKAPAVLVVHEIFGLTDWAQEETDEIAAAGYIAITPDLLSGLGPKNGGTSEIAAGGVSAVTRAVSGLPPEQVTADLDAAADYIKGVPACNGKLFVVGFCWGGGKAFAFATHRKDLTAAFVFYGVPPPVDEMANISCPVYAFYAGNDARITVTVPKTKEDMKAAGKTYEPVIYPGAGHGFMRAGEQPEPTAANKSAREAAWKRWKELLAKNSSR